jgi:hypothetical protein
MVHWPSAVSNELPNATPFMRRAWRLAQWNPPGPCAAHMRVQTNAYQTNGISR